MVRFPRAAVETAPLDEELETAAVWLSSQGVTVHRFHEKAMLRRRIALDSQTLVIGRHPTMRAAMQQLAIPIPEPVDYPDCLRGALHRRIWRSTLGGARAAAASGASVFVKPARRSKRFTGTILDPACSDALSGVSRRTPVWCAEVVQWQGEHRCFVQDGAIVDCRRYSGVGDVDLGVVAGWADLYARHGAPRGYAMDCGLLADGTTALVECNDGFALGRYGAEVEGYVAVLAARWGEVVGMGEL
ncbi:MAG: hypothetical protein ACI8RZ_003668 [Myxococcota bacterium]|jgi:hypothetical protein